ncbi:exonuclease SbcCD subunit D [Paenibacillus sp. GXUN7292]|uniref:exonuclease SbcCD subunit D n=1 Tax=Paenibacillus sp. GXUN7292 TaxID=3422499 RepID=UPI003D7CE8DE
MKFFHTADWHLGKLVQGVYMTEDQRYVLSQLLQAIEEERPDAVIIAGDLYDRAVPPTEAVELLDEWIEHVVIRLQTPLLAISGNHDSPDRLNFGTRLMEQQGMYLAGQLRADREPVKLKDEFGEVHVHLIPFADPAQVRLQYEDDSIRSYDDAMRAITERIGRTMDKGARHIAVAHAFVTPAGDKESNTSDSERPLAIGGAEYVNASYFDIFDYTALGHLHKAHFVRSENIRYAGSPLKYSISEERHNKGYYIVEMDADGSCKAEKRELRPLRDMRSVVVPIEELEQLERSDDYVFATLLSDNPILFPMEKVRAIFPNAMHVERRNATEAVKGADGAIGLDRHPSMRRAADPVQLFSAFYNEVKGMPLSESKLQRFAAAFQSLLREESER